jgi:hypothetical protein
MTVVTHCTAVVTYHGGCDSGISGHTTGRAHALSEQVNDTFVFVGGTWVIKPKYEQCKNPSAS